MKALILAGGEGKRLRPLTNDKPKPLLEVGGKPIIEWQIEWMKKYGVSSFVISAGYMKEKLIEHLGTGSKLGVDVSFEIENEPLGTGGAIKSAKGALGNEKSFVVANGDIITNMDLGKLIESNKDTATISLTPLRSQFGIVNTQDSKVTGFQEKPFIKDYWLNAGIYVMTPKVFDYVPDKGSLELVAFPAMVKDEVLGCVKFDSVYWRSVDSFKDFDEVSADLNKNAVFV
jgi:mannose-1-phosphate guanylyltransferase